MVEDLMSYRTYDATIGKIIRKIVTGVSINAVADAATFTGLPAKWRLRKLSIFDVSTSLAISTATLGLYTAAAAGGSALVALATMTALTGATKVQDSTLAAIASTDYQTGATAYLRCGIAHGSAATVSVAIEIEDLT
jgi:hypothetical protein